ncbi:putative pectinesterase/pectinesterase inhibitor 20 [Acorus calamus]|uniref:Pectinesterase/pectinesterase inhibitor 20 n=1 Tax=Acorus calamus TaxID=4465 RepID=A0AAV9EV00_ACOCL|nr:putative pectinesterase/pectinesterase inhibitor 20 [Acorus calamus]
MAPTSFSMFCLILTISAFTSIQSASSIASSAACDSTTYPHFCHSSILPRHGSATIHDYFRFTIAKSLSAAHRLSSFINSHLARAPSLSAPAARALNDCELLSDLNIDYLSKVGTALNSSQTLLDAQVDEFHSLLSAAITNQRTCLDALRETPSARRIKRALSAPLANGAKLYSVGLSLFVRAWTPDKKRHHNIPSEIIRNGTLVVKMSDRHQRVFETRSGRMVVQDPEGVFINDMVVVSKDGTGNFTTITDALGVAPKGKNVNSGYFLIYITAGVYKEYVKVNKNHMYVMMVGDGINQTIITGDHSNSTGWKTFGGATVGVTGRGFVATNITIRNTAGPIKGQAVALMSNSDMSAFYGSSFEGYQDTLYKFFNGERIHGDNKSTEMKET